MAESLDDRILELQRTMRPAELPRDIIRVPITGSSDNLPEALPGDVSGSGGADKPTPVGGAVALGGGAFDASPTGDVLPEPTPVDNTPQRIEQRRAQALEALKAEGFDGYTPELSSVNTPDDQHAVSQAVTDIMAGFNISLARGLSLPRETVDRGLAMLGLDFMQHGSPQQQTIDSLNRMGIPAYEVDNLANKIGKGALPALATWAAMQAAAPSMAAAQGTGTVGYLMRQVGEWSMKHPVVGMWLGQTAQAGGKAAVEAFGDNPAIEFAGELAGGAAPGAAKFAATKVPGAGLVRGAAKFTGQGINALSENLPTDLSNAIKKYNPLYKTPGITAGKTPLIDEGAEPDVIQSFAKDQIYAAQTYQDKAIESAINSIPSTGTPAQVQTRTHDLLQQAEKISKRIVSGFWERVPLKTKIDVGDMREELGALKRDLVDLDNQRPDTMIDKLWNMVKLRQDPDTGKILAPPKQTIQKLRDFQSQIGTAITEERARDAPREGMVRNLARLSDIVDAHITRMLPNNTSIEQARQMSKRHNDLFSRGPINDILSKRRTGDFRVPVADSIDSLLQKTDGLAALKAVQEGVSSYPRIPTTRFQPAAMRGRLTATTPAEDATLNELVKSAEDSIRASFREAAEAGPQKAVAYSQRNEDAIKALSRVAGELNWAAQRVAAALDEKKAIQASALARFAETSPEKAVQNLFTQKDPAAVARQLMVSFRGDPDALEGLRNQILNELIFNKAKTNPNVIDRMMKEPGIENLLQATLSSDQWQRLRNMVNTAVRLGVEDETGFKSLLKAPFRTVGRIGGAMIGRKIAPGTLQGPSIFSNSLGKFMENTLGGTYPQDLLAQAVLDPHWERLLYSRIPTTTREMKAAETIYRRIFSGMDTAQSQTLKRLYEEKGDDE
jgi:hypothetical protein